MRRRSKKTYRSKKPGNYRFVKFGFVIIGLFALILLYKKYRSPNENLQSMLTDSYILNRTEQNYGKEIDKHAHTFHLPAAYLKALVVLECSGRSDFEPRFEAHVYQKLLEVRNKKRSSFGSITHKTIHDASDDALKNLATSWGPFQLMGYQCLELDIKVKDIRGENAVYWGINWINKRYGKVLKKERYKDAFHIHNTGRPYPANGKPYTHDPTYVERGLRYMEYFQYDKPTSVSPGN